MCGAANQKAVSCARERRLKRAEKHIKRIARGAILRNKRSN
jgi:hypothetical protein